jgi:hypothetical protein
MRIMFANSRECRAWIDDDGSILALGGVVATLASSRGSIWLAVSDAATKRRFAFVREAWRQLAAVTVGLTEIDSFVARGDRAAWRFATAFGFEPTMDGFDRDSVVAHGLIPIIRRREA